MRHFCFVVCSHFVCSHFVPEFNRCKLCIVYLLFFFVLVLVSAKRVCTNLDAGGLQCRIFTVLL